MAGKPGRSLCKAVALLLNLLELAAVMPRPARINSTICCRNAAGYGPLRQTSCRLPHHADDPRRSGTICKEINIQQSSEVYELARQKNPLRWSGQTRD